LRPQPCSQIVKFLTFYSRFPFFTDNVDVTLEGDAQNPNAILVKGSESQDRLNAFTQSYNDLEAKLEADSTMAQADKDEILKMHCFDYVWENPTDPVAHYVMYRYKWAFGPCELRTMIDNIHHADSTLNNANLKLAEEYVVKQERVQAGQPMPMWWLPIRNTTTKALMCLACRSTPTKKNGSPPSRRTASLGPMSPTFKAGAMLLELCMPLHSSLRTP